MTSRLQEQKEEIDRVLASTNLSVEDLAERVHLKEETMRKYAGGYQPASSRVMAALREIGRDLTASAPAGETHYVAEDEHRGGPRATLKAAREKRGLSHEDLARLTKVPAAHLRDLEEGPAPISDKVFERLKKELPDLDREQFFSGSDTPPTVTGINGTMGQASPLLVPRGQTSRLVPRLSDAQAGQLVEWTDDLYNYEGVPVTDLPANKRGFAVRVRGDSMEPRFFAGDDVIAVWGDEPRNGQVVVAMTSRGEPLVKIYSEQDQGRKVVLTSYNPAHPPQPYSAEELRWVWPVHSIIRRINQ